MTKTNNSKIISVVHRICCGLDVHKDKYYRLKSKRGAKRAIVAIAHRITKTIYYIIKHGRSFVDLGQAYFLSKSKEKRIKILKMNARHLGFSLVPVATN